MYMKIQGKSFWIDMIKGKNCVRLTFMSMKIILNMCEF